MRGGESESHCLLKNFGEQPPGPEPQWDHTISKPPCNRTSSDTAAVPPRPLKPKSQCATHASALSASCVTWAKASLSLVPSSLI